MSDQTWPPRWTEPHFKKPVSAKVIKVGKAREVAAKEDRQKTLARGRDKFCRFPLCGCTHFRIRQEVGHTQHKGMGGNPKGDRSKADKLILMCAARHQENAVSVHHGTLRVRPLTEAGTAGPCAFLVAAEKVPWDTVAHALGAGWVEVGRETSLHVFERFTPEQGQILRRLGEMKL